MCLRFLEALKMKRVWHFPTKKICRMVPMFPSQTIMIEL